MKNFNIKQDRRNFNKSLFVAGLGSIVAPNSLLDIAPLKKSGMKLGLVTYLWGKDWDLDTLIQNCEKTKLGGVELRVEHAHNVHTGLSMQERKEVKMKFEDSDVVCLGMGTNQDYHHTDQNELRESIEKTKEFIKLSYDIGASGVKVKPNAIPDGVPKEKTIEQIGKSLNEVAAFGEEYGQQIRVEVHGRETQQLPNMKAIFDVADHPNATVCWNCNDQDLIGEGLEHNFNLVKDRFGDTVHVREFNEGNYPYQELMNLFKGMKYGGWILLECRTDPSDRIAAMEEQHKIFKKMLKGKY